MEQEIRSCQAEKIDNYETQVVLEYCRCIDMDLVRHNSLISQISFLFFINIDTI